MSRKMLINALEPEESRIAVVEGTNLEEFYIERTSRETLVGNVYKGRVANILPSLRAAFVDIGLRGKNGFLHASDVVGSLERNGSAPVVTEEAIEDAADRKGREEPPIQKLLQPGQEVLVQVSRDGMGEKGPSLTMDISLPGRYLVITPRVRRVAVSKRIAEPSEREALRILLEELNPPHNLGFIIRTAGAEKSVRDLKRDLDYLLRLWKAVVVRAQNTRAPAPVFQESDLVIRTIRDIFTTEIDEIFIDSFPVYNRTLEFFQAAMPRYQDHVKFYRDPEPIFYKFDVERQIDQIYLRVVPLPAGGSIVIDQTEALTAIDVNSGRFTKTNSPEEMAFRINMEAAQEVVRQLRLRDLGGQIIVDFIDMKEEKNRQSVERVLREAAKLDRSQSTILRMSRLGLVEMARQKVRPGVKVISFELCWHCHGTGYTKNVESQSLQVLRQVRQLLGTSQEATYVEVKVHPEVATYLQNVKRRDLVAIEDRSGKSVVIRGMSSFRVSDVDLQCLDESRQPVKPEGAAAGAAAAAAEAQSEARRRESDLRRSMIAAAQESRAVGLHAEPKQDPASAAASTAGPGASIPAASPAGVAAVADAGAATPAVAETPAAGPAGPAPADAAPVPAGTAPPVSAPAASAALRPVAAASPAKPGSELVRAESLSLRRAPQEEATPAAAAKRRTYGSLMKPVSKSGRDRAGDVAKPPAAGPRRTPNAPDPDATTAPTRGSASASLAEPPAAESRETPPAADSEASAPRGRGRTSRRKSPAGEGSDPAGPPKPRRSTRKRKDTD